jgi:hypothetical protein
MLHFTSFAPSFEASLIKTRKTHGILHILKSKRKKFFQKNIAQNFTAIFVQYSQ